MDCAALCVVEWPHGDDAGAGRGRRGRELRDQRWVRRRLPCEPDASIFRFSACSANGLFRWMVLEEGCVPVHVQGNRAEPRIETGLHGDRAGACQDGRRCALQGSRWVRAVAATRTMRMALVSRSAGRSMHSHGSAGAFHWVCSRTALHSASSSGHTETAMALIEAGADVHCKDNDGYRLVHTSRARCGCLWISLDFSKCRANGVLSRMVAQEHGTA